MGLSSSSSATPTSEFGKAHTGVWNLFHNNPNLPNGWSALFGHRASPSGGQAPTAQPQAAPMGQQPATDMPGGSPQGQPAFNQAQAPTPVQDPNAAYNAWFAANPANRWGY